MENKKYRFEFRFGKKLLTRMQHISEKLHTTKSCLIRSALEEVKKSFTKGLFHNCGQSDFLSRECHFDKKRFEVILNGDEKDLIRKLSFTWKMSQAELLRLIVEYFVYVVHGDNEKNIVMYTKKIRYTVPKAPPVVVVYDILNNIEKKYCKFHYLGNWKLSFS